MKKITILYSNPKKFMLHTPIIKYVDKSDFSHTCLLHKDSITGQDMIYQASHGRVHSILFEEWLKNNNIISQQVVYIKEYKYIELLKLMNKFNFTKYGYMSLLGILFFRLFKTRRNLFAKGVEEFICSEIVAYFIRDIMEVKLNKDIELMSPKDCFDCIREYQVIV